jgi:predicted dinucleotide-binding enzyme
MRIGILGSGLMGGKLGTIFGRAGHEVAFSYARSNHNSRGWRVTLIATRALAWRCHE